MNNKIKHSELFNYSGCLSEKALIEYLNGKLSKKDAHIIEMHLLECDLCSDAIDGFSGISEKKLDTAIKNVSELNPVFNKQIFPKWLKYTSVAAAIAIIITSTVLTFNFDSFVKKETANLRENNSATEKDISKTTIENKNNEEIVLAWLSGKKGPEKQDFLELEYRNAPQKADCNSAAYYKNEDQVLKVVVDETKTSDTETLEVTGGLVDKAIAEAKEEDKPSVDGTVISGEKVITDSKNKNFKKSKNKEATKSTSPATGKDGDNLAEGKGGNESNNLYNDAIALFNSSKFEEAITKFEDFIKKNPDNCDARYYCAISYYEINNTKSALKQLDHLTKSNDNNCYEKARFQKAVILNKTGKKLESEKIFKKIIEEKGPFKNDAEKELNK